VIKPIDLIDLIHDSGVFFAGLPSRDLGIVVNGFVSCPIDLPVRALLPLGLSA